MFMGWGQKIAILSIYNKIHITNSKGVWILSGAPVYVSNPLCPWQPLYVSLSWACNDTAWELYYSGHKGNPFAT